jgi:hypothetical protein
VKRRSICGKATASLPARAGSENLGCGKDPAARPLDAVILFCASTFNADTQTKQTINAAAGDKHSLKVVIFAKSLVI